MQNKNLYLISKLFLVKKGMGSKCQSTYIYTYILVNFSVMNEPNCSVYKGCRADKWRPQGDSNPCCRRERAVS